VVDGIDTVPDQVLEALAELVEREPSCHIVTTSGPLDELTGRAAAFAAKATEHVELLPLSARRSDIPGIAARMLKELRPDGGGHLTGSVLRALASQNWEGSLPELYATVSHAARRRTAGALTMDDLPAARRVVPRQFAPRDQAERDVIVSALRRRS